MKSCSRCAVIKSLDAYHRAKASKDGYFHMCKQCRKEYSAARYQRDPEKFKTWKRSRKQRIKEEIASLKTCCIHCSEDDIACLDFHHTDPNTKEFAVAHAIAHGWGIERIRAEITKCVVICSNCHRKAHYYDLQH